MIDVRMTSVLIELSRHSKPMPVHAMRKNCTVGVMAAVLKDARSKGWATSLEPGPHEHLLWQITPTGRAQLFPTIIPTPVEGDAAAL
jgi:hypothetical protein